MGNLVFCNNPERKPLPQNEKQIMNIVQSYKPDRSLHFEDGKVETMIHRNNTYNDDNLVASKKITINHTMLKSSTLEEKPQGEPLKQDPESHKSMLRTSYRPGYTIDIEKKERRIQV